MARSSRFGAPCGTRPGGGVACQGCSDVESLCQVSRSSGLWSAVSPTIILKLVRPVRHSFSLTLRYIVNVATTVPREIPQRIGMLTAELDIYFRTSYVEECYFS